MLSGLLIRSSLSKKENVCRDPITAQKVDLSIQAVAQVGCGKAVCSYTIENDEDYLVFCVSSLLAHRDSTRQRLKVTDCRVHFSNRKTGEQNHVTLYHSKSSSSASDECPKSLPSLTLTKEQHANTLTSYAGAISSDDLLIHLGPVKAETELKIQLEFLIKFILPPSTSLQYIFTNKLPTHHLCYKAYLASSLPVDNVTPLHIVPSSTELKDFQWVHIAGPSVIQVQYECIQHSITALTTSGFTVQLASGSPSGCCSLNLHTESSQNGRSTSGAPSLNYDGIMMFNSSLTVEQFPTTIQERPLHPAEFVFVVDCSGSMSGSNIQAATDTLIICIKSLPPNSYFNVIAFGSNFKHLFYTSVEYTKRTVEKAIQFANQMQASLGGTEILVPLRWIFKQSRIGNLARQIFIITDGGVNNTQSVLHTVKKNRHQARCHTFGIGSEVCTELVTGIAAASGGRCVLLKETERLQTKVMEVLRESLHPYISDSSLRWTPPEGFSLLDSTPKSLGTVYTGSVHTAFALLKREEFTPSEGMCPGCASITGQCGDEQVHIDVGSVLLPPLTPTQTRELAGILDRVATWSKLQDMEFTLMSGSRKNSHTEADKMLEPEPKRIKLNGSTLNGRMVDSELYDELVELSLSSGIPCSFTCFRGEGLVQQILPQREPSNPHITSNSKKVSSYSEQKRLTQLRKMQSRNHSRKRHEALLSPPSLSMSSIVTAVSSKFKSVVSSFGLAVPEPMDVQNGHRIEDHLQYESQKKSSLHWDETRGKLVYPSYYRANGETDSNKTNGKQTNVVYPHSRLANGHRSSPSMESSSDDEDFSISDTESDSSLDPDWEGLRRPSELRPLIQMQLYSGAWPMVRAFSYAVGVPLEEVRKLLEKETKQSKNLTPEEDEKSNVWTTALAIACMEEYFPHLKAEWEVVGLKGREWLKENLRHETDLTLAQVTEQSKKLVTKWLY